MAHGHISSTDALQRVFPTTVPSYLQFRGWICQEALCDRSSVTFDLSQCAGRTNCRLSGRPSIDHQAVVVEGDLDAVGVVQWYHLLGAPFSGWFPVSKTIIPEAQEHFLTPSARRDTHLFGGLGVRAGPMRRSDGHRSCVSGR